MANATTAEHGPAIEVIGRNSSAYDAVQLSGNLAIVGKYVVIIDNGICQDTVCRATKSNLAKIATRARIVG